MNRIVKFLVLVALIASTAAVISLQRGELVFFLGGYEIRSAASAVIALLVVYTLAIIALTRIWLFLFRSPAKPDAEKMAALPPAAPVPKKAASSPAAKPQFVEMPLPLDAAPPVDDETK